MAERIPLIVNVGAKQLQELPNGDSLHNVVMSGLSTCNNVRIGGECDVVGQLEIQANTASTSKTTGALTVTGGVGIGLKLHVGDDITAFAGSDKRLKDNITPIPNAVDKVLSISGNTFNWNEKSDYEGKADTGVIAQEIEALDLPGITETRDSGYKAVRYEKLVPLLIEAIKELKAEVDELKSHSH